MKIWVGGSPKSSKVIRGDHFNEVTFKRGNRLNFTLFSPKSPPPHPPAINNDRSLKRVCGVAFRASKLSQVAGRFVKSISESIISNLLMDLHTQ